MLMFPSEIYNLYWIELNWIIYPWTTPSGLNFHSFIKSWFLVCNHFHLIPQWYFHWKILWKSTNAKEIRNPRFIIELKKECHLLSDKLESMEIESRHSFVKNNKLFLLFIFIFKRGGIKWQLLHTKNQFFIKEWAFFH